MLDYDLIAPLLTKIVENQLALEEAIFELTNWVEERGGTETCENVDGVLATLDKNEDFIKLALALLNAPK